MFGYDKNTVSGRSEIVKRAVLESRLEGVTPDAQAQQLFSRYIDGEISLDDALQEIAGNSVKSA